MKGSRLCRIFAPSYRSTGSGAGSGSDGVAAAGASRSGSGGASSATGMPSFREMPLSSTTAAPAVSSSTNSSSTLVGRPMAPMSAAGNGGGSAMVRMCDREAAIGMMSTATGNAMCRLGTR